MNSKMRKSNHSSSSPSSSLNHSLLCFFYKRIGLLDLAMMQAKCALAQTSQPQYPILPLVPAFELARLMCLQAQYTLADAHIQSVWTHIYSSGGNDAVDEEFSAMVDAFYIGVKNITTSSKRTEISKLIDTIISTSLLRASSESKSEKLRKSRAKSFRKLILDTYSSHSPTTLLLLTLHFSNDLECISMSGLGLVQSLFEKDVPSVETTSQMSPPDCLAAALVFKHIAQEQWLATLSLEVSRDTTSLDASPYTPLFLKRTESLLIKCIDHTYNLFHSAIFSSSGNNHSPALMTLDSSNLDSFYWCAPHASLELALVVGALARRDMCRLYLRQCTKSGCISLNTASSATVTNTTPRTPKKPVDIPAILATGSSSHSPSLSFKRHFASSYNSVSSPINVEEEAESEANTTSLSNCSSMSNSFVSSIGSTSVILLNASPSHPQQQQHQSLSSSAKFSRRVPKFIFHDQWLAQCSRSLDASKGQKVK